jgi:hypothetical protein
MKKTLPLGATHAEALLGALKTRFERHESRHRGVRWADVQARLKQRPDALAALHAMERTGGQPDVVVGLPETAGAAAVFCDCAEESPVGRRSVCYDPAALDARKENKPPHSALGMAADLGVTLLTETQYRALQQLGEFDLKTSSWVLTPPPIRALGGALFCDRRYDTVFTYHNGVQSYYAARGFRGWVGV